MHFGTLGKSFSMLLVAYIKAK